MVRPKRKRRIAQCPKQKCFNKDINNSSKPINLSIDEFEAIRLKDYHEIKQKESAELMGISQSTFHRILNSAKKKIAISLIEGREIVIGDDFVSEKIIYICNNCGFQWSNPQKTYDQCPDCKSENIKKIEIEEEHKPFRGHGQGECHRKGDNKECHRNSGNQKNCKSNNMEKNCHETMENCKCPNCGYEEPKIKGSPCRNKVCPECGTNLSGSGKCHPE
ncbi:MAG: DUF134 domain-containing protein [Methanobacteriaceae archaeon]|jgi:hypothetical protein|nr:DUF134 domain-containing protein [Methanobacteriaceae archaeon]